MVFEVGKLEGWKEVNPPLADKTVNRAKEGKRAGGKEGK